MSAKSTRRFTPGASALVCLLALFGTPAQGEPISHTAAADEAAVFPLTRPSPETATKPGELLLNAVVTWLSVNFDLPASYDHPKIEFASPKKLAALRFGATSMHGEGQILAVYLDAKRTIYLPEKWSGRTPAELSMLVHEMVHHLQNVDKHVYNCPAEREKLAFDAQEKWLQLFGRSLESEFQIDPFTRLVATRCM